MGGVAAWFIWVVVFLMRLCEVCGANLAIVGRRHRCVPMANIPEDVANGDENMANAAPDMANRENGVANTYRYRDVEKRRAYMREYMRRRRATL